MIRTLLVAFAMLASAGPSASQAGTYLTEDGVEFEIPDTDWEPVSLNAVLYASRWAPQMLQELDEIVPGTIDAAQAAQLVYMLTRYEDAMPIGQLSLSLDPLGREEEILQSELNDPVLVAELKEMIPGIGQQTAQAFQSTEQYVRARYVNGGVYRYGEWACISLLFEVELNEGAQPYHMSIQCPAGAMQLRFTAFVEQPYMDSLSREISNMIAATSVARAKWRGAGQ